MNFPRNKNTKGFTLVEMIIYVAFFAVLSVLSVNATILVMRSFYTLRITQNISQSATTAMERLSREIRNAYDIDTTNSTFSSSPGRLTLKTKDAGGANTTVEFYVDASNQLNMKVGGVDQGSLLVKSVSVANLTFTSLSTLNSKAVKVEMTLSDTRSSIARTIKLYDTIVIRGSVH